VVWTRGNRVPEDPTTAPGDPSDFVRTAFLDRGFCEVAFERPDDAAFRVGVARFTGPPRAYAPDLRMFTFV